MKQITTAALAALTLVVSLPSFAQGVLGGPDSAWYVGGSIGQSNAGNLCTLGFGGTCDDTDTAYRIFGGYQVNRFLALELGYQQLGDVKVSSPFFTETLSTEAYDVSVLGILPLSDKFGAYGRLGIYHATLKVTAPPTPEQKTNNDGLTYGVGVTYDATRNLSVRAEWAQYGNVGGGLLGGTNFGVVSIGALWRFR